MNIDNETLNIYSYAIRTHSADKQVNMALEECGEFIVAVNKVRRAEQANLMQKQEDVCGEIADVMIMMEQMAMIFGMDKVMAFRKQKIERLKIRLDTVNDNMSTVTKMLSGQSLRDRLHPLVTMLDKENWDNGKYHGKNGDLVEPILKYIEEWLNDGKLNIR